MNTTFYKAILLALTVICPISLTASGRKAENINFKSVEKTVLEVFVDGQPVKVDR